MTTQKEGWTGDHRREIFRADGRVPIGKFDPKSGVFVQSKLRGRHALKNPPAWAMDESAWNTLEGLGAVTWAIYCSDTNEVYRISFDKARAHKWTFDRGSGYQIAVRISHFSRDDIRQLELI